MIIKKEILQAHINRVFSESKERIRQEAKESMALRIALAVDRIVYKDEQEYLERPDVPKEIATGLVEALNRLNHRSGYYAVFLHELGTLIETLRGHNGPVSILDLGAGTGGLLKAIGNWARKKNLNVELWGLDLNPESISVAQSNSRSSQPPIHFLVGDATDLKGIENDRFDVVISSYMVHHIRTPGQVGLLFSEAYRVARQGWMITDLDRRWYAPWFAFAGAFLFGAPRLIVADAFKSARRAYQQKEIEWILRELEIQGFVSEMHCTPYPGLPYWLVKGRKT